MAILRTNNILQRNSEILALLLLFVIAVLYVIDCYQGCYGIPHNLDDYEIFFRDFIDAFMQNGDLFEYLSIDRHGYKAPFYRLIVYLAWILDGKINLAFVSIFFSLLWLFGFLIFSYVSIGKSYGTIYTLPFILLVGIWTSTLSWTGVSYYTYIVLTPFFIFYFLERKTYVLTLFLLLFYVMNVATSPFLVFLCYIYLGYHYVTGSVSRSLMLKSTLLLCIFALLFIMFKSGSTTFIRSSIVDVTLDYLRFSGAPLIYALPGGFRSPYLSEVTIYGGLLINIVTLVYLFRNRASFAGNLSRFLLVIFFIMSVFLISVMREVVLYPRYELLYFGFWGAIYSLVLSIATAQQRRKLLYISFMITLPLAAVRYMNHNRTIPFLEFAYSEGVLFAISGNASKKKDEVGLGRNHVVEKYLKIARQENMYEFPELSYQVMTQAILLGSAAVIQEADHEFQFDYFTDGSYYTFLETSRKSISAAIKANPGSLYVEVSLQEDHLCNSIILPMKLIGAKYLLVVDKEDLPKGTYDVYLILEEETDTFLKIKSQESLTIF